jgi:lysophospholipase L1-like esterase
MKDRLSIVALFVASFASACSDAPVPTLAPTDRAASLHADHAEKYVALGTSIGMGWQSDGVYYAGQLVSYPSLLAFGTGRPITLPLIQSPGCVSPLVTPLAAGKRLSGESAAGSTVCAPNVAGVTLPTQNVSISTALAADALVTPSPGPADKPWYQRVLPPGATQLTAALAQQPTIVSVEFGGNEVLGALSGLYAPGVTVVPFPFFAGPYTALLDAIGTTHAKAVLFEMPTTATRLPALRPAEEIWADRLEFAALHVDVSADCHGSPNYINVSIKSLNAAFDGAFRAAHGLPNATFSCADIPGTPDLVITPSDVANLNALLAQMRAFVEGQAAARGYALASLGALYDRSDLKTRPYSIIHHLTSPIPMGLFISLDGVHPSAFGHGLLAFDAARAINAKYGASFARAATATSPLALKGDIDEVSPSMALEMARSVAAENRGVQLSPCFMGACRVAAPRR